MTTEFRVVEKCYCGKTRVGSKELVRNVLLKCSERGIDCIVQMRCGKIGKWITIPAADFLSWFEGDTESNDRENQYRVEKRYLFMGEPPDIYYFNTLEDVASCIVDYTGNIDSLYTVTQFDGVEWVRVDDSVIMSARFRTSHPKMRLLNILNGNVSMVVHDHSELGKWLSENPHFKLQFRIDGVWVIADADRIIHFLTGSEEIAKYILKKHNDGVIFLHEHQKTYGASK